MKYESICNGIHKHNGHWFNESNMRFFRSKIYETVYCGKKNWYFVSSERFSNETKRLFTVREFNLKNKDVTTKGGFQEFKTKLAAERAAKKYAESDK